MPQRLGLGAGAALTGTGATAEASCRKMRSLRRRVHRSSSLASGPASKPGSLGPRSFRVLRPFSAASLAFSGLEGLGPRALGAGTARLGPGSPRPFLGRSSPAGDCLRSLTSLSESVYSNSVPAGGWGGEAYGLALGGPPRPPVQRAISIKAVSTFLSRQPDCPWEQVSRLPGQDQSGPSQPHLWLPNTIYARGTLSHQGLTTTPAQPREIPEARAGELGGAQT